MNQRTLFNQSLFLGVLFFTSGLSAGLKFSNINSMLKLKNSSAQLRLETPITGFNGTLNIVGKTNNSVQGATGTDKITFTGGIVSSDAAKFVLNGVYNPATGDTIELGNNDKLEVGAGSVAQSITVAGTSGNASIITGQPIFTSAIVLNGATNFLTMGIQNKLTQNITLAGGTVTLSDDLVLQDEILLSGNGTVDLASYSLILGANITNPWAGNITFKNALDIQLNGYTTLNGQWDFTVTGSSSLNGNGNVLDLTGGGTIGVAANHTLYISDVHIKGLGSGLGDFSINAISGRIRLSNVTLELGANYAHSAGELYIQGDNCRIISGSTSGGNYQFNVSSTGKLTVDHAVLEYETLTGQNISPLTYTSVGTQLNLINGGTIRSATLDVSSGNLIFDVTASSPSLQTNYDITSSTNVVFTNSLGGAQSMTVNGNNYFLQFPGSASGYFQVANDLTVNLQNMILKDFNGSTISYGTNSVVNFGDGCVLELNNDVTLGSGSKPWTFNGNAVLDGYGHVITLHQSSNRMTITGNKTLIIRNAKLHLDHASALACLAFNSKIEFQNVDVCISNSGYTFALGNIDVTGHVKIRGCDQTVPGGISLFTYSTTGTLTVQRASILELWGDLNFSYQAGPTPGATPDSTTYTQSKRKLKMLDPSATLHLNGCTLTSTTTALALDHGNLIIEDSVGFDISAAAGSEAEFGTALDVKIKSGAILEVGGPLKYVSTTYP